MAVAVGKLLFELPGATPPVFSFGAFGTGLKQLETLESSKAVSEVPPGDYSSCSCRHLQSNQGCEGPACYATVYINFVTIMSIRSILASCACNVPL